MRIIKDKNLKRLSGYLKNYKKYHILGAICVFFGTISTLIYPVILGYVIDRLKEGLSFKLLIIPGIIIIGVEVIGGIFKYFMRQTIIKSSRLIEFDMINDLFATLQNQSANFFHKMKTGDIISRATSDIQAVRMMIGPGIMQLSALLTRLLFTVSIMFYINAKLTLLAFFPLPFMTIITKMLGSKIHRQFKSVQEQYAALTAKVQENISGIRVIKAYTQEINETIQFEKENKQLFDKNMSMFNTTGIFHSSFRLFTGAAAALTLWYGGVQVIQKNISLGDFVAFSSYLALLTFPMMALGWVINLFQRGTTSMKRLNFIYEAEPEIFDSDVTIIPSDFGGNIEFKNLSFSYNTKEKSILKSINLKIKGGTSLAIIGQTGSGKTSLINLIPRLFNPPTGTIFIDGIDILEIPLKVLRENIGFVTQETFLFSDTIKENIALNIENDNMEEIEKITSYAQIKDEIDGFYDGFESMLGERGINLSGGQKQRTALARALLKKTKILILDDPFSSVDTSTEEIILGNLKKKMKSQTTIIISHRISTIKECDLIIVLSNGEIIEKGNHEQLLKLGGTYKDLYEKQLLKDSLENNSMIDNGF
jgi:ATP-binding cassette, subfamily B, multidrug efflux pump